MSPSKPKLSKEQLKEYDRLMLRSALVSLFWSVISDLKKRRGYKLQKLANDIGVDKSGVSRWFSGNKPNWTLNTVSDICNALNVDLLITAVDRETHAVYTPQGPTVAGTIRASGTGRGGSIRQPATIVWVQDKAS
jgi:DNA-binding Xre family transcriptional regulator